jgi:hypothetical protein
MTLDYKSGSREIAEHARRVTDKCHRLKVSGEAVMRAQLMQMPLDDGLAIIAKLQSEWITRKQEQAHSMPEGSRRDA